MSRWDALKPCGTSSSSKTTTSTTGSRSSSNVWHPENRISLYSKDERVSPRTVATLVDRCNALCAKCRVENPQDVLALSRSFEEYMKLLPSDVAGRVVQNVLLAHLNLDVPTDNLALLESQKYVLQTLNKLLKDTNHSAAIMAPLVEEVTYEGKEILRANPVRCYLFQTLERILSTTSPVVVEVSCRTLVSALEVAVKIDHHERHADLTGFDVNAFVVQSFCVKAIDSQLRLAALQLLQAFLQRHPDASPGFAMTLLESTSTSMACLATRDATCQICSYTATSPLIVCLHNLKDRREVTLAYDCTVLLLDNIPLALWMRKGHITTTNKRSTLNFHDRISRVLQTILTVVQCRLSSGLVDVVAPLAKLLLSKIPYENCLSVQNTACELVNTLCGFIPQKTMSPLSSDMGKTAVEILIEVSGGRITPAGKLTTMCVPLRVYLRSEKGVAFVKSILANMKKPRSEHLMRLFRAFVRSYPALVVTDDGLSKILQDTVQALVQANDQSVKVCGIEIIEGLLRGRFDYPISRDEVSHFDILHSSKILYTAVTDGPFSLKRVVCVAYACLTHADWITLSNSKCGSLKHIRSLVSLAGNPKATAKVRSDACKCIGDVSSQFFDERILYGPEIVDRELNEACELICPVLLESAADSSALVRSMAFFAVGNLAQMLKKPSAPLLISPQVLIKLADVVGRGRDDPDDKASGNAIRSIGHVAGLLLRNSEQGLDSNEIDAFLQRALLTLSGKVRAVFILSGDDAPALTWKQRMAVKKQGWGACNALSMLFDAGTATRHNVSNCCEVAIAALLECLENIDVVNEKVVACAAAALHSIDYGTLSQRTMHPERLGKCIATCIVALFRDDTSCLSERLHREVDLLLLHLLRDPAIVHISSALHCRQMAGAVLNKLFDWMMKNDCSSQSFSAFALAMQKPGNKVDVDVEQRFASRALSLLKNDDWIGDEL